MKETTGISIPEVIKSYPILAAAASFLYAGLGQVLCGKIKREIVILVFFMLVETSYRIVQGVLILLNVSPTIPWQPIWSVPTLIRLFTIIWAVYDACRVAGNLKTFK